MENKEKEKVSRERTDEDTSVRVNEGLDLWTAGSLGALWCSVVTDYSPYVTAQLLSTTDCWTWKGSRLTDRLIDVWIDRFGLMSIDDFGRLSCCSWILSISIFVLLILLIHRTQICSWIFDDTEIVHKLGHKGMLFLFIFGSGMWKFQCRPSAPFHLEKFP